MIKRALTAVPLAAVVMLGLAGCSSGPSIDGTWAASDGSATKIINDDGSCSGMYYNQGKVLDIGGPETCALSSGSANGYYTLTVRQSPNQASYEVVFGNNTMTIYSGGAVIVTLTKQ